MTSGVKIIDISPSYLYRKQWAGADDPEHKQQNAYVCTVDEEINSPGKYCPPLIQRTAYPYSPCNDQYWPSGGRIEFAPSTGLNLAALHKATEKVRDHGLDLGNYVAEGRQTIGLAVNALKSMTLSIRSLKRGDIEGAVRSLTGGVNRSVIVQKRRKSSFGGSQFLSQSQRKALSTKSISDQWLSLQYGWVPLLSDVFEAGQAWEAITNGPRKWTVSGQASNTSQYEETWGYLRFAGNSKTSIRYKLMYSEPLSTFRSLGLSDPVGVAWEAIPFSFVADWFLPIGDYIDTMGVLAEIKASAIITSKQTCRVSLNGTTLPYTDTTGGIVDTGKRVLRSFHHERSYSSFVEVPLPTFKPLVKSLSVGHLSNAVALLRSLL